MDAKNFSQVEFLEQILLPDLRKMAAAHLHYYAFSIICQGIELLGSAKDELPLDESEQSESRFTWALAKLFKNDRYRTLQGKFFKFLRGPLV